MNAVELVLIKHFPHFGTGAKFLGSSKKKLDGKAEKLVNEVDSNWILEDGTSSENTKVVSKAFFPWD